MSQSPVSGKSRKLHEPVLPKKFREEINNIKKRIDDLIVLAIHVGRNASVSATINVKGKESQEKFGAQAIKIFKSRINKKLDSFASEYSNTYRSKKSRKSRKELSEEEKKKREENRKIPNLSKISDDFRKFWEGANLGPVNIENYSNEQIFNKEFDAKDSLASKLPMLTQQGITSSSLLQSAWSTYVDVNRLKEKVVDKDGKERSYLKADKYMRDKLGTALDWLANNKKDKKGNPFNADQFERKWLATIGSFYTIPRPGAQPSPRQKAVGINQAMTEEVQNNLRQLPTRENVKKEIDLLKQVRDKWRKRLGTVKKSTSKRKASLSTQQLSEGEEEVEGSDVESGGEEVEEENIESGGEQEEQVEQEEEEQEEQEQAGGSDIGSDVESDEEQDT
jgi:hypothetical protein